MTDFKLDPRLAEDCLILGHLHISQLLLMNNSLLPWFILVPETSVTELIDLPKTEQADLLEEINGVSAFVRNNFQISKLNIAAIGNVVSQLHVHVVGRDPADYCWPNVVWGRNECRPYSDEKIAEITEAMREQMGGGLKP